MTDVVGNPEEERRAEFYYQPWSQEAVSRYFYCKVQQTDFLQNWAFKRKQALNLLLVTTCQLGIEIIQLACTFYNK